MSVEPHAHSLLHLVDRSAEVGISEQKLGNLISVGTFKCSLWGKKQSPSITLLVNLWLKTSGSG